MGGKTQRPGTLRRPHAEPDICRSVFFGIDAGQVVCVRQAGRPSARSCASARPAGRRPGRARPPGRPAVGQVVRVRQAGRPSAIYCRNNCCISVRQCCESRRCCGIDRRRHTKISLDSAQEGPSGGFRIKHSQSCSLSPTLLRVHYYNRLESGAPEEKFRESLSIVLSVQPGNYFRQLSKLTYQ